MISKPPGRDWPPFDQRSWAIGPRRGLALAGIGYGLLKLVPGVAEAASPLLGGTTRRDSTDLLALTVLLPIWFVLGRREPTDPGDQSFRSAAFPLIWGRVRRGLATMAPVVGIVFAAAATTATSCGPTPAVVKVTSEGNDLYALVERYDSQRWAISGDGGRTWHRSDPPSTDAGTGESPHIFEDPGPTGTQDACAGDGTCWRLRDRRSIERVAPDGRVVSEFQLTDSEFAAINTGCAGGSIGVLASITTPPAGGDDPPVVASLGADGALVRRVDGTWDKVRVLSAPPDLASRAEVARSMSPLLLGFVLALSILLVGRRRWPSWQLGLAVTVAGWAATSAPAAMILVLGTPDVDATRVASRITGVGMILTAVAAILVSRRRPRRPHPVVSFPPDPHRQQLPPPPSMSQLPPRPGPGGPPDTVE